jgi:hypothetical protein
MIARHAAGRALPSDRAARRGLDRRGPPRPRPGDRPGGGAEDHAADPRRHQPARRVRGPGAPAPSQHRLGPRLRPDRRRRRVLHDGADQRPAAGGRGRPDHRAADLAAPGRRPRRAGRGPRRRHGPRRSQAVEHPGRRRRPPDQPGARGPPGRLRPGRAAVRSARHHRPRHDRLRRPRGLGRAPRPARRSVLVRRHPVGGRPRGAPRSAARPRARWWRRSGPASPAIRAGSGPSCRSPWPS